MISLSSSSSSSPLSTSHTQHESDRFRYFINQIQSEVNQTIDWLTSQDTLLFEQCHQIIEQRLYQELSVTERLIEMIRECVLDNIPIHSQWQVTYDGISVRNDRRIFPYPPPEPTRHENIFQPTHLNHEQVQLFEDMLSKVSLNQLILKEDMIQLLTLCQSNVGPYGHSSHVDHRSLHDSSSPSSSPSPSPSHTFHSLVFPKLWREQFSDLVEYFNHEMDQRIDGTHEIRGIISHEEAMRLVDSYGEEKYQLLLNWTGGI